MGRIWKTGVKERARAVSWKSIGLINTAVVLEEASERHTKQTEATVIVVFFLFVCFCQVAPTEVEVLLLLFFRGRYEEGTHFKGPV